MSGEKSCLAFLMVKRRWMAKPWAEPNILQGGTDGDADLGLDGVHARYLLGDGVFDLEHEWFESVFRRAYF